MNWGLFGVLGIIGLFVTGFLFKKGYDKGVEKTTTKISGEIRVERQKTADAVAKADALETENSIIKRAAEIAGYKGQADNKEQLMDLVHSISEAQPNNVNGIIDALVDAAAEREEVARARYEQK